MIRLHDHLINPLHVAAILPAAESPALHAASTYTFAVILSGGNELLFKYDDAQRAAEELKRLELMVDQASTRR